METELAKLYVERGLYKRVILAVLVPTLNYTRSRGEVYRPGRYEIRGTVTLVQAIAEGGNFTEFANKKKIQIIRGTQFIEKNYFDILSIRARTSRFCPAIPSASRAAGDLPAGTPA